MGLEQLDMETGLNKVDFSIKLIQTWQPLDDYYLSFSGGKDSIVLLDLAIKAQSRYKAYYHASPLDPPEQIKFIRIYHPHVIFEHPQESFWKAFAKKGYPLRKKRWCCEYIKEWGGSGKVVLLGLRSDESRGRKHRCFVEQQPKHKTRFADAARTVISPILRWTDYDVWQYIRQNDLPYCSLYDEGFKRLGCVMCPLASPRQRLLEYYRFPRIALAWYKAFERLYRDKPEKYADRWQSADEMFWWWMGQKRPVSTTRGRRNEKVRY